MKIAVEISERENAGAFSQERSVSVAVSVPERMFDLESEERKDRSVGQKRRRCGREVEEVPNGSRDDGDRSLESHEGRAARARDARPDWI